MGSPDLFDGLCELLYKIQKKNKNKKKTRKHYLNMAEKMLRNVSELIASVSHYEILEGERFGPKFAPIRTAVCLFFFVGGGGGVLVNTAQLIDLFVQGLL